MTVDQCIVFYGSVHCLLGIDSKAMISGGTVGGIIFKKLRISEEVRSRVGVQYWIGRGTSVKYRDWGMASARYDDWAQRVAEW